MKRFRTGVMTLASVLAFGGSALAGDSSSSSKATAQSHHCEKDGATIAGKTHKDCTKAGGTWAKGAPAAAAPDAKAPPPAAPAPAAKAPPPAAPAPTAPPATPPPTAPPAK